MKKGAARRPAQYANRHERIIRGLTGGAPKGETVPVRNGFHRALHVALGRRGWVDVFDEPFSDSGRLRELIPLVPDAFSITDREVRMYEVTVSCGFGDGGRGNHGDKRRRYGALWARFDESEQWTLRAFDVDLHGTVREVDLFLCHYLPLTPENEERLYGPPLWQVPFHLPLQGAVGGDDDDGRAAIDRMSFAGAR